MVGNVIGTIICVVCIDGYAEYRARRIAKNVIDRERAKIESEAYQRGYDDAIKAIEAYEEVSSRAKFVMR